MKKPVWQHQKYTGSDALWLFSKVILFLLVHLATILMSVAMAVWAGAMAFITTDVKLFGLMIGLGTYMAGMAGRSWLNDLMVERFFSIHDVKEMGAVIGDNRGPKDP